MDGTTAEEVALRGTCSAKMSGCCPRPWRPPVRTPWVTVAGTRRGGGGVDDGAVGDGGGDGKGWPSLPKRLRACRSEVGSEIQRWSALAVRLRCCCCCSAQNPVEATCSSCAVKANNAATDRDSISKKQVEPRREGWDGVVWICISQDVCAVSKCRRPSPRKGSNIVDPPRLPCLSGAW